MMVLLSSIRMILRRNVVDDRMVVVSRFNMRGRVLVDSGSPCRVLGADDVNTPGLGVRSGVLARGSRAAMTAARLRTYIR